MLPHSPASPSIVAYVIFQKSFVSVPYYRLELYMLQLGVKIPRETMANWYIHGALDYWIYLSGSDGLPSIVLYDYEPGRSGEFPKNFLEGFSGMIQCDGYSGYNKVEEAIKNIELPTKEEIETMIPAEVDLIYCNQLAFIEKGLN